MNKLFEQIRVLFKCQDVEGIKAEFFTILESFVRDNSLQQMFFHPLGFIYSKLHEFDNQETIRLHVWDKEYLQQTPIMEIHNHFYTVNSLVLLGKVKNILYESNNSKEPNYSLYKGSYNLSGDRLLSKTDKSTFANIINEEQILKDEIYKIFPTQLHSSFVDSSFFTCTLVYTESPSKPIPIVLGPLYGRSVYTYSLRPVAQHQATNLLLKILTALQTYE